MTDKLSLFFAERNIEYYSVLDYKDVKEIYPHIIEREGFAPKSVIIYVLPYYTTETVNISRYAASLDYHIIISKINSELSSLLKEEYRDAGIKGYGDHSPIDERHAALIAGLGIAGDNGLLINERYGSYVFIADLLTDISPNALGAASPKKIKKCPSCGACKKACPTGILSGEGSDCLSAITQRKGALSETESALMRKYNTAWGCDECQRACPYNKNPKITPIEFFHIEKIENLTLDSLLSMDKEQFSKRAFAWRGRATVERNLKLLK